MTAQPGLLEHVAREATELTVIPPIPEEYATAGLVNVDREDMVMPRVTLTQPTSQTADGLPGTFHHNLTNDSVAQIHAVLLNHTKSRVYWDKKNLGADPLCASDDAKMPRAQYAGGFGSACADCPMAEWGAAEPPACKLVHNFLAANLDDGNTPFLIALSGTSVKHARKVLTTFKMKRTPLFSRPVTIGAVEVKNDKGRFFEIVMTPNGGGADFDWRPFAAMYRDYKTVTMGVPDADPAEPQDSEEIPF